MYTVCILKLCYTDLHQDKHRCMAQMLVVAEVFTFKIILGDTPQRSLWFTSTPEIAKMIPVDVLDCFGILIILVVPDNSIVVPALQRSAAIVPSTRSGLLRPLDPQTCHNMSWLYFIISCIATCFVSCVYTPLHRAWVHTGVAAQSQAQTDGQVTMSQEQLH